MKVILSNQCEAISGTIQRKLGYHLTMRGKSCFAIRNSKGSVPSYGHWAFIVLCAQMAQQRLHITDIKINWLELQTALYEAKCFTASEMVRRNYADKGKANYDAADILNLKTTFSL
jgi:hypothetical protein